jgi:hypothetical protein
MFSTNSYFPNWKKKATFFWVDVQGSRSLLWIAWPVTSLPWFPWPGLSFPQGSVHFAVHRDLCCKESWVGFAGGDAREVTRDLWCLILLSLMLKERLRGPQSDIFTRGLCHPSFLVPSLPSDPGSRSPAQTGFELMIFLPQPPKCEITSMIFLTQPPKCWNYKHISVLMITHMYTHTEKGILCPISHHLNSGCYHVVLRWLC